MLEHIERLPGNHIKIKLWNYNPVAVSESLKEKQAICRENNCKAKPTQKCLHYDQVYFPKWEKIRESYPKELQI